MAIITSAHHHHNATGNASSFERRMTPGSIHENLTLTGADFKHTDEIDAIALTEFLSENHLDNRIVKHHMYAS
jgi:hypothetical protein